MYYHRSDPRANGATLLLSVDESSYTGKHPRTSSESSLLIWGRTLNSLMSRTARRRRHEHGLLRLRRPAPDRFGLIPSSSHR